MANGDLNNNRIPDSIEGAATRPSQFAQLVKPSNLQSAWETGAGNGGQSMGDGMVRIPTFDENGQPARVDPDVAKSWWQAQAVQNTEAWRTTSKALKGLGYKTNSQMLSAISSGIEYTQNPYAGTDDPFSWISAQEARGSGGSGSGGPYTQVQTSTNISSPSRARTVANQAFESEIGRMATKDESTQFQQALNLAEQGSPTTSVTNGVSQGRNTTASTKTTGGFDAAAFGRDWARSQSDFAESYAAGSFMGLLDKVISQPNAIEQIMKGLA